VLTAFMSQYPPIADAMCHCFESIDELSPEERDEIVASHTEDELRAECTPEELKTLGVAA